MKNKSCLSENVQGSCQQDSSSSSDVQLSNNRAIHHRRSSDRRKDQKIRVQCSYNVLSCVKLVMMNPVECGKNSFRVLRSSCLHSSCKRDKYYVYCVYINICISGTNTDSYKALVTEDSINACRPWVNYVFCLNLSPN